MKNPCYRASILPLMQTMLATLGDLDFAHERELRRIDASSSDAALKAQLRGQLEDRHRERREPYVQQLGALEVRLKAGMPDVRRGPLDRDAA
jgi:hypothetical protein